MTNRQKSKAHSQTYRMTDHSRPNVINKLNKYFSVWVIINT